MLLGLILELLRCSPRLLTLSSADDRSMSPERYIEILELPMI